MTNSFTVAGKNPIDLDQIANQLRAKIDALAPGSPLLAAQFLNEQSGLQALLVVVRGHEAPHTHPDGDLVISVLIGGGYVLLNEKIDATAGSTIIIPKGVCHAYYNLAEGDSVLLATFSPINSKGECPLIV